MSRLGNRPIVLPENVEAKIEGKVISIKGSLGEQFITTSDNISLTLDNNQIFFSRKDNSKTSKAQQGLTFSLIKNMIEGVTNGYVKELELIGIGLKVQLQGNNLLFNFFHWRTVSHFFNVFNSRKIFLARKL